MNSIKVNGGRPVFGEVSVSGDTESAISLICFHLINKTDISVTLDNIPRSSLFSNPNFIALVRSRHASSILVKLNLATER